MLKHLSDFLALLDVDSRREYLPKLPDFLKMDNERNWRFRLELTEQLERLLPLFSPADVDEHISPMVMVLIRDKVSHRHSDYLMCTERGVLSVARFCSVFPCELPGPAWSVGSYSSSQSAGGTSQNIIFKTLQQI